MNRTTRMVVGAALIAALALPAFAGGKKEEPKKDDGKLKVAMVLVGPTNDAGWNESAYRGLKAAEAKFGITVAYSENVAQPDFETVMTEYASKGYDLVIGHGLEFMDPTFTVAKEFPKTKFAVVNGTKGQEPNVSSFRFDTPQVGFIAGTLAGLITKNNKVGIIGGMKYPHVESALNSFAIAAKYVNPKCEALVSYLGSWDDVPKGKEMAMAMIDQGVDVIAGNANQVTLGIIDAADKRGIKAVGYISDQYDVAPKTVFGSALQSVDKLVEAAIKMTLDGKLEPKFYELGYNDGAVGLADMHGNDAKLSAEQKAVLQKVLDKLKDGSLRQEGILPTNPRK